MQDKDSPVVFRLVHLEPEVGLELGSVIASIRRQWVSLLLFPALFGLVGFAFSFSIPPKFEAVVVVAVDESSRTMQSALSSLGGMAALAGLGVQNTSKAAETVRILESRYLAQKFISAEILEEELAFAPSLLGRFRGREELSDEKTFNRALVNFDRNVRRVAWDRMTGIIELRIRWNSPAKSMEWADSLVSMANREMRNRVIQDSERSLEYLRDQLESTNIVSIRQGINSLIEEQLRQSMIASVKEDFAVRVLEPAYVINPDKPDHPRRSLIVAFSLMLGLLVAFLLALRK